MSVLNLWVQLRSSYMLCGFAGHGLGDKIEHSQVPTQFLDKQRAIAYH